MTAMRLHIEVYRIVHHKNLSFLVNRHYYDVGINELREWLKRDDVERVVIREYGKYSYVWYTKELKEIHRLIENEEKLFTAN